MNKSTRFIVTAAAMAGLYAGSVASRGYAEDTAGSGDASKDASKDAGKHDCKGQNSCKGMGWSETVTETECTSKGGKVL